MEKIFATTARLLEWDHLAFASINQKWIHPHLDTVMIFVTSFDRTAYLLVAFVLGLIFYKKLDTIPIIAGVTLAIVLSDVTAARIAKPYYNRTRPEFTMKSTRLIVPSQSSPSFPSNHAANCFAGATVLAKSFPQFGLIYFAIATLVAYSRVYVGVHHPLDIIAGAALGLFYGILIFNMIRKLVLRRFPRAPKRGRWN